MSARSTVNTPTSEAREKLVKWLKANGWEQRWENLIGDAFYLPGDDLMRVVVLRTSSRVDRRQKNTQAFQRFAGCNHSRLTWTEKGFPRGMGLFTVYCAGRKVSTVLKPFDPVMHEGVEV